MAFGFDDILSTGLDIYSSGLDEQNKINQQYTSDVNSANSAYTATQNAQSAWVGQETNRRDLIDYGSDQQMDLLRTQTSSNMFDTKYGIAQQQAGYDKFQAEFGDMQDNVYGYMKSLSKSSRDAQINDNINNSLQTEMTNVQQQLAEQGIMPSSGFYQASQMQLQLAAATEKVKQTRNTAGEIAAEQQNFMNNEANSKYFNRAEDFSAGVLDKNQLDSMVTDSQRDTRTYDRAGDIEVTGWDTYKADVEKAEREKFLGLF